MYVIQDHSVDGLINGQLAKITTNFRYVYVYNYMYSHKCDWICEKGSCMHNYKYLEIPFWNIQFIIQLYLKNAWRAFLH